MGRVVLTCEEMLRDRGCASVARADDLAKALEEGTRPVLRGRGGPRDVDVYVHAEERVGVKYARAVLEASGDGVTCLVVSVEGPTPFTRKECEGKPMEFFCARELVYNVTKHHLVPPHEVVPEPPEGTTRDTLPKMLETDPVARYYAWPVGTVVRVVRRFGGCEPIPYFRVVVGSSS